MNKYFLISLLMILYLGCETPYQPKSTFKGGYSDFPIGKDSAQITFAADSDTSRETVEKYFLYRCAEYTLVKKYRYFILFDVHLDRLEDEIVFPGSEHTTIKKDDDGTITKDKSIHPPHKKKLIQFHKTGKIRMLRDKLDSEEVFNAQEIIQGLEPHIKREHF